MKAKNNPDYDIRICKFGIPANFIQDFQITSPIKLHNVLLWRVMFQGHNRGQQYFIIQP